MLCRLLAVRNVLASVVDIGAKTDYDARASGHVIIPKTPKPFPSRLSRVNISIYFDNLMLSG